MFDVRRWKILIVQDQQKVNTHTQTRNVHIQDKTYTQNQLKVKIFLHIFLHGFPGN